MFVKNPYLVAEYCNSVKGRWLEAEQWSEAERAILVEPSSTLEYSYEFTLARDESTGEVYNTWKPAEATIARDPQMAAQYANILARRWKPAEATIATNPTAAYMYTVQVLNSRWPEAESTIKTDKWLWNNYKNNLTLVTN